MLSAYSILASQPHCVTAQHRSAVLVIAQHRSLLPCQVPLDAFAADGWVSRVFSDLRVEMRR
jgi:hypothetical protein